jgi:UDP-3-O-[3-hydroxymyristoyl] glucosamine N-acyltransferase
MLHKPYAECSCVESNGAWIAQSTSICENAHTEPGYFVDGDVHIGDGAVIMSEARVRRFCMIWIREVVRLNPVIRSDGFGHEETKVGRRHTIRQLGG